MFWWVTIFFLNFICSFLSIHKCKYNKWKRAENANWRDAKQSKGKRKDWWRGHSEAQIDKWKTTLDKEKKLTKEKKISKDNSTIQKGKKKMVWWNVIIITSQPLTIDSTEGEGNAVNANN